VGRNKGKRVMVKKVTAKKIANLVHNTHSLSRIECAETLEENSCSFGLHLFSSKSTKLFTFFSKNSNFYAEIVQNVKKLGVFAAIFGLMLFATSFKEATV
jgi:hypothetical protein